VRVTPGARRNDVTIDGSTVRLRITAPPADGAANNAVLGLLAAALSRPRRDLTLLRGATGRIKLISIAPD
jgi:hypothetical protein